MYRVGKIKYWGGAIFAVYCGCSISSCCFAGLVGTELRNKSDLDHLALCIEFKSNVMYHLNDKSCADWIKKNEYKESIYNVVSDAVADCILEKNEFSEKRIQDGVVTFENNEVAGYTPENWNAVVLYNLVYFIDVNREQLHGLDNNDLMERFNDDYIKNRIKKVHGDAYEEKIKRAYSDIKEYNKELDIIGYLRRSDEQLIKAKEKVRACESYKQNGLAKITLISSHLYKGFTYKRDGRMMTGTNVNIYIKNNKVERAVAYEDDGMYSCDLDDFMNMSQKESTKQYGYPKADTEICERAKEALKTRGKIEYTSTKNIQKNTTRLLDAIDVATYRAEDGKLHLGWLDVDESYHDKAYTKWAFTAERVTLGFGMSEDLYLDKRCLSNITIPDSKLVIELKHDSTQANWSGQIYLPKNTKNLIAQSNSIELIELSTNARSESKKIIGMINNNANLKEIDLEIKTNKVKKISGLINQNSQLGSIKLHLRDNTGNDNIESLKQIIRDNKDLKEATIDLDFQGKNLKVINGMFDGCTSLEVVNYVVPWDENNKIKTEHGVTFDDKGKATTTAQAAPQIYKNNKGLQQTEVRLYQSWEDYVVDNP